MVYSTVGEFDIFGESSVIIQTTYNHPTISIGNHMDLRAIKE